MKHAISRSSLLNGIKILYIDIPGSKSFDMAIAFKSGYRFATKDNIDNYESPHVLEHIVFDGSKNYPSSDILQDIFSEGGGTTNGVTTFYHNIFMFHNRVDNVEPIVKAALDMVFFPLLTEQSFNEEMQVIDNELQGYMGDLQMNASMYAQQQAIPDMPISTDSQLARLGNVTYDDIKKYHEKYYCTSNASIVLSADFKKVSSSNIESLILDATKSVKKGKSYTFPSFDMQPTSKSTSFVPIHKTTTDSVAAVQFALEGRPQKKEMLALTLFCFIANSMKSYSMTHKLRKQGLIYGLSLESYESKEAYGLELLVTADNGKFSDVYAYTLASLRDYAKEGIGLKEFESARKGYIEGLDDEVSSTDAVMGWYLSDYLMEDSVMGVDEYKEIVRTITQPYMLEVVDRVVRYNNAYQVVFSSKGIRASSSMEMLSKEILENGRQVNEELIQANSISLVSTDRRFKLGMAASLVAMLSIFSFPFMSGGMVQPSLSHELVDFMGGLWFIAVFYFLFMFVALVTMKGVELRKLILQMASVLVGLPVIMALFELRATMSYFTSSVLVVQIHASMFVLVALAMIAIPALSMLRMRKVGVNVK